MPPRKRSEETKTNRRALDRNKVGDICADLPGDPGDAHLRVSFRRNWYSPPLVESGEVDYEAAATDLAQDLQEGTIVLRNYLENGELGYGAEIRVVSKDELERVLRTIRKIYQEGLKQDNAIRQAALDRCKARLAEIEKPTPTIVDQRREMERRIRERRGRQLLGRAWFRRDDRRIDTDRRRTTRRRRTSGA